jgi:ferredoxin--NADP+ reductase
MVTAHNHTVRPVTIRFSEELSPGIWQFAFPREFEFEAGQVIGISMEENGPRRLYSICSGEKDEEVWVLYNVIEEGYLTPRLTSLEEGDTVWITEPRGEFLCGKEPAVWVAAGTGIAPFYSMHRSGRSAAKFLIHGEKYLEQFHFYDDFSSALGNRYIRCCSGEEAHGVYHGRVTSYLAEQPLPGPDLKYYLCGSAEMVVDTRDILIHRGIPFNKIVSEIYF